MQPFDLLQLLLPAALLFLASALVAFIFTRSHTFSLLVAVLKAGTYLVYFGYVFDGTYTMKDDWNYLEGGEDLAAEGVGILNLAEHWDFVLLVGRGAHFIYYLQNAYAFRIFGFGYYAPVALNILLTLPIAWLGARIAQRELAFTTKQAKLFFGFLLLHPDIFAWSNIMNGKDVLVLLLHVLLLYSASLLLKGRTWVALTVATFASAILLFVRFYVPILFAAALLASQLWAIDLRRRLRIAFVAVGLFALAAIEVGEAGFQYALLALSENIVNPFYGFVRMALTPIPFNTEVNYSFLNIPALIHWILVPFVFLGLVRLYRLHTPFTRLFLVYLATFMILYAVFGELQGPRHRVQLDFAWALLQFVGLMTFARVLTPSHPHRGAMASGSAARMSAKPL